MGAAGFTNTNGRTAYILSNDTTTSIACTVASGCIGVWPPIAPPSGVALTSGFTAFTRSDNGATQPAYNGHPLYAYAPMFMFHADSVDALLTRPLYLTYAMPAGTAIGRSHLTDAGLGFDDGNRLRIDVMAFRETVGGSAYGTTAGSGVSLVWQVAPSLAIRSWALISHNGGGYVDSIYTTGTTNLDRSVTWLTAGNVLRVDAIWRGSELAGDVSLPAGSHARFVAGTRREGASRVLTAGISWR